ncbi:hypothetical protein OROGR_017380 [Orobanche gracilis]
MAIFRAAVNTARRRFSSGVTPPPPPPRVPFLQRNLSMRVSTIIICMAGWVSGKIAYAIYPPPIEKMLALIDDDASENYLGTKQLWESD